MHLLEVEDIQRTSSGRLRATAIWYSTRGTLSEADVPRKIAVYMEVDSGAAEPELGDLIAMKAPIRPIRNAGNPGEPDIAGWFATRGIFHQASVRKGDWMLLDRKGPPFWTGRFQRTRELITGIFRSHLRDSAAVSLAVTLLTGYRTAMDPELLQAYSNTGVIHVIAISGLHLGLIHALLLKFMIPLTQRSKKPWLAGLLALPPLWLFSFFTGASASVMRSAAMFTGLSLGACFGKRQALLNSLPASAVLLLAIRPDWIADIGFQLSYAALLSIGLFQPFFRNWVRVTNPAAVLIRDLVAVTLSAQVLTAPLVAYHFHRLPFLFVLSNLVAVPLSSIILLLEILVCVLSSLTGIADLLGNCTTLLITAMNSHVTGMDAIPHAGWEGLRPSPFQTLMAYVAIGAVHAWRVNRVPWGRQVVLLTMTTMLAMQQFKEWNWEKRSGLVVFRTGHEILYAVVEGRTMLVLTDPEAPVDPEKDRRTLEQAMAWYGIRTASPATLRPNRQVRWKANCREWQLRCGLGYTLVIRAPNDTICLLLSGRFRDDPKSLVAGLGRICIVADASVPLWKIQQWKSTFEGVPSRFHSVPEQGAFLTEMEMIPRPHP
jgi:competence protein ComEC